jgi:hypothetical protein
LCLLGEGGKLTPRHAMHSAKAGATLKTRGRTTARSLCSGGFLPPPPAHLGRAGVATPAEACPPCAELAAFGAACSTARASRVLRIISMRRRPERQRLERYAQPPPPLAAQAGGKFAAASRRPKATAIARWSRRYGSEEKRAGRAAADLLWLYLAAASPAHRGDHAHD